MAGGLKLPTLRRSPTMNPLPFQLDPEPATETLTSYGGVPLVVQAFRSLGLPQAIERHLRIKQRERGYDEATFVESFVILNAVGGECLEDFDQLRADTGLAELVGHAMPSPEAARNFLYAFHEEVKIEEAQLRLKPDQKAYIPEETVPLQALTMVNRTAIGEVGRRCSDQKIATVDQDATIIESRKREAKATSEGDAIRSCAEVAFVPGEHSEKKDSQPLRYIAIRIEKKQERLYEDGSRIRHFAVVTNIGEWSAPKLIQWHREKAGTVELVHDVLKNELAAGVLPCGRFGANAAWLRLSVITHNVLTALKRLALPAEYLSARPKRLRFFDSGEPTRAAIRTNSRSTECQIATITKRYMLLTSGQCS